MTTLFLKAKTNGRVRAIAPARSVVEVNLSDPKIVQAIIKDATKVTRAEQAKRRKGRSIWKSI